MSAPKEYIPLLHWNCNRISVMRTRYKGYQVYRTATDDKFPQWVYLVKFLVKVPYKKPYHGRAFKWVMQWHIINRTEAHIKRRGITPVYR